MLPQQQTPFVLTAITLRGIGSYLHGARLEVRPLTILCGKNGSGKSTWLKVLNLLRRSLEANRLPFGFDIADWETDDIQFQNAFYHLADPEDHARLADPELTMAFGPPGTIGLEFSTVRDIELPIASSDAPAKLLRVTRNRILQAANDGELTREKADVAIGAIEQLGDSQVASTVWTKSQRFLWLGQCAAGLSFRVRLAHPSYHDDSAATPHLYHLVEMSLDDHGKPRPMLVLARQAKREHGRRWFIVVRITSKGQDHKGKDRDDVQPMGKCIDPNRESFAELRPNRLPENLLHGKDQKPAIVKPCDPLGFSSVCRIVTHKCLAKTHGNSV